MKIYSFFILTLLTLGYSCKTIKNQPACKNEKSRVGITSVSQPGKHATVTGMVKNRPLGKPLQMIPIEIRDKNGHNFSASTNEQGQFTIKEIPLGNYNLTINHYGFEEVKTPLKINKAKIINLEIELFEKQMSLDSPIIYIDKPVIYLYPKQKQEITVELNYDGELTHTYPAYPKTGWKVIAEPNGTLWDEKGQEYYALFWEGKLDKQLIPKDGFIVPGHETASFLEEKLAYLGLNRREANEFIMYWLPLMEDNPYNLIHFAGTDYEKMAGLKITPKPETIIRVMMYTRPLQNKIDFPLQNLTPLKKVRKGFTVLEWGGSRINLPPGS